LWVLGFEAATEIVNDTVNQSVSTGVKAATFVVL